MMEPQDTPGSVNKTGICQPADTKRAREDSPNVHPAEALWRECGLPEYFLGNGGTNTKLYAFYGAIVAQCAGCVPTNWCDALLTGPDATRGPLDAPAVERLLVGTQNRIREIAADGSRKE